MRPSFRSREAIADFARLASARHLYAAAAGLWADAFAASPELAADPTTGNRLQAARAAALAGAEVGPSGNSPDDRSRAHWRGQAVAWLEPAAMEHETMMELSVLMMDG